MLEQPIYLLMGAGLLILLIALFLTLRQKGASGQEQSRSHEQKLQERQEMEKSLQRFVHQVKQENELVVANLRKTKENLRSDLDQLEERIQTLESELGAVREQLASSMGETQKEPLSMGNEEVPRVHEDTLFLRERFQRAFALQREGLSLDEIAKQLGAGRGELELIFSLATPQERGRAHE
ncbi:RNA polymerase subunit sigma-70 [Brevibacillus fluminis]|uniref:RNA polymerase subunit sigma-70 n=1 Tax=Brevibacillus fluminis TaxID=511487 RepID=A0A3M8DX85_9BACL|nr:RNA polymerase subunit sigma-70 [Brevibacillus fluminis]RNB91851.1 RNA polymerase subunit sigma-70 [Brevibacillus fluminis]